MLNKKLQQFNTPLFLQLVCFMIAVSFSAGGGEYADKLTTYNAFIYFKLFFLICPVLFTLKIFLINRELFFIKMRVVLAKHYPLLGYFFFAYLSIIFAYDWYFSLLRLLYTSLAVCSLICLMVQYYWYESFNLKQNIYHHLSCFYAIFLVLITIISLSNWHNVYNIRGAIQKLGMIHPNTVASVCVYIIFHEIFNSFKSGRFYKILGFLNLILAFGFMSAIFSRSVVLAFVIAFIVIGIFKFFWFRAYRGLIAILVFLMVLLSFALAIYLNIIDFDNMVSWVSRTDTGIDLITLTHRTELWAELFQKLNIKAFLIGNGYGVMTPDFGIHFGTGIIYGAHNLYLSILFGTGIFSLIAFMVYLLTIFISLCTRKSVNLPNTSLHGLAMLTFFMVHSLTSTEFSLNLSISFAIVLFMSGMIFKRDDV